MFIKIGFFKHVCEKKFSKKIPFYKYFPISEHFYCEENISEIHSLWKKKIIMLIEK